MRFNFLKWITPALVFLSISAQAGYFEIGASGSYRKTSYDKNNYDTYRSGTGSIAYYFWEMSALELSYTKARQDEVKAEYQARSYVEFYGTDFIFSLAPKTALFQPYLKVGMSYQRKSTSYKQKNQSVILLDPIKGWAPSAGAGFKFIIGEHLALKVGLDAWSSPINKTSSNYDYAGRLGLSFLF